MIHKIKKAIITIFTDKPHQRPKRAVYSDLEALRHLIALIELYRNTGQERCAGDALQALNKHVGKMYADLYFTEQAKRRGIVI